MADLLQGNSDEQRHGNRDGSEYAVASRHCYWMESHSNSRQSVP